MCQVGQTVAVGAASGLKVIASEGDPGTSGGKLRTDGKVKTRSCQADRVARLSRPVEVGVLPPQSFAQSEITEMLNTCSNWCPCSGCGGAGKPDQMGYSCFLGREEFWRVWALCYLQALPCTREEGFGTP